MSNIASSKAYIQVESARQRSATSEFLAQTIGGAINYLNDQDTSNIAQFASIAAISVLRASISSFSASPGNDLILSLSSGQIMVAGTYNSAGAFNLFPGGGSTTATIICNLYNSSDSSGHATSLAIFIGSGTARIAASGTINYFILEPQAFG